MTTLQTLALEEGLDAGQVVVPLDHVTRANAANLPAIAVTVLPDGFTHVVLTTRWSHGWTAWTTTSGTGPLWSSNGSPRWAQGRRMPLSKALGDGLFELRFSLGPTARRITYRFTTDGRIILLTTFRKQRNNERTEITRARKVADECSRTNP